MRIKSVMVACAIAAFSTAGLAACGDDDDGDSGSSTAASAATTTAASGASTTAAAAGQLDPSKDDVHMAMITIKIPGSDLYTPYLAGANAAADQINESGGWGGAKVVIDGCNSQLQAAVNVTCARKTLAKNPVAMIGCDTNWGTAGLPLYQKAGVPSIWCLQNAQDANSELAYGFDLGGPAQYTAASKWICDKPEVKRVAVTILDIPALHDQMAASSVPILKACGKETKTVYFPITMTDYTTTLNQVTQFKPDWILVYSLTGPQAVQIYKSYQGAGFPASKTTVVSSSFTVTNALVPAEGAMEGVTSVIPTANPGDEGNPDVAAYTKAVKAAGVEPLDPNVATGYVYTMAVYETAKKIGFDKATPEALGQAFNTENGLHMPMSRQLVNPGPKALPGIKQPYGQLVTWKDGKIQTITEGTEDGWINGQP